MAKLLDEYRGKKDDLMSQIAANSLPLDEVIVVQELNYRISVLETLQALLKTAPITTEVSVLGYHFSLLDAQTRFLLTERRFGTKTDNEGQKRRTTAANALEKIVQDGKKRFTSFVPDTQDTYKQSVAKFINTVIPAWLQYREAYVTIKIKEA